MLPNEVVPTLDKLAPDAAAGDRLTTQYATEDVLGRCETTLSVKDAVGIKFLNVLLMNAPKESYSCISTLA